MAVEKRGKTYAASGDWFWFYFLIARKIQKMQAFSQFCNLVLVNLVAQFCKTKQNFFRSLISARNKSVYVRARTFCVT